MSTEPIKTVRGVVRAPICCAVLVGSWTVFALAWVGGMVDPPPPVKPAFSLFASLFVAASIVAAIRATRLGVTVTDSHAIVRNLLSTRRVRLADVERVQVRNYDGAMTWNSSTSWLCTVALTTRDGELVEAYGLTGLGRTAARAAGRVRDLIGLPEVVNAPQHRAS